MTPQDRVLEYSKKFPRYAPLIMHNNKIYGLWMMGNTFASHKKFYGEFPNSLLNRILSLFPECPNVLHLFSGTQEKGITYDINPYSNPTICDDVMNIVNHKRELEKVNLVIADPPYTPTDFEKYGTKPINKRLALRNIASSIQSGTAVVWLDLIIPIYRNIDWNLLGLISVITSTNRKVRILSLFSKK